MMGGLYYGCKGCGKHLHTPRDYCSNCETERRLHRLERGEGRQEHSSSGSGAGIAVLIIIVFVITIFKYVIEFFQDLSQDLSRKFSQLVNYPHFYVYFIIGAAIFVTLYLFVTRKRKSKVK